MRDPKRIDQICTRLAQAWKHCPDMRLTQIFCVLEKLYASENRLSFYAEDEEAIEKIEQLLFSMGQYL